MKCYLCDHPAQRAVFTIPTRQGVRSWSLLLCDAHAKRYHATPALRAQPFGGF